MNVNDDSFTCVMRHGHRVNKPINYEPGTVAITQPEKTYYENNGVACTRNYCQILADGSEEEFDDGFGCVGTGIASGIENTEELKVMKFD